MSRRYSSAVRPTSTASWSRYAARPLALANERVRCNAAGQVVVKQKTAWRDATTHLVMSPPEIMQRPAAPQRLLRSPLAVRQAFRVTGCIALSHLGQ